MALSSCNMASFYIIRINVHDLNNENHLFASFSSYFLRWNSSHLLRASRKQILTKLTNGII